MKKNTLILLLVTSMAWSTGDVGTTPPDGKSFSIQYQDVKSVYDGDTFTLHCPECEKGKVRVRLLGVDTPEIRGQCAAEKQLAVKAREFLKEKFQKAHFILVSPNKDRLYDRYGRLLASLIIDEQNVSQLLIENQLGREYQGGKRLGWCL